MWLSINELTGLPGLPSTERGCRKAMLKLCCNDTAYKRKREGSKAFEYHIDCLPDEAQKVIKARHIDQLMKDKPAVTPAKKGAAEANQKLMLIRQCPALLERRAKELNDQQRRIADARCLLAQYVLQLEEQGNLSRVKAVEFISTQSRLNGLPEHVQKAADTANARKGSRTGVSARALNGWVLDYLKAENGEERLYMMAPEYKKPVAPESLNWMRMFEPHYHNLNAPELSQAYRTFKQEWLATYAGQPAMLAAIPSIDAVRRAMRKYPLRARMRGRVSGSSALAYETYKKRDWSLMPVNGCWISDGKALDMKVKHPIHGKAFKPEITLVIDGRTRYIVGWSLSLSENRFAVADAYRYAMQHHGKPLFVYTDNGGGETNKMLDADITGIFPRMNITHMTSIPGCPQSRGIIERLNKEVPYKVAQRFATFNGRGADNSNVTLLSRNIVSASNALENGKELNARQRKAYEKLPSWQELIDAIAQEVDAYNFNQRHSSLPKVNGQHLTPAEYRQHVLATEGDNIEYLTPGELREMFMPEEVRIAQRGWVSFINNDYFSEELINVDGEKVRVRYDIHDASEVTILRMDGTFVCRAIWNGNKQAAIPVSAMEKQMEARAKRRIKRHEAGILEAQEELRPALEHRNNDLNLGFVIDAEPERITTDELYLFESDKLAAQKSGTHD